MAPPDHSLLGAIHGLMLCENLGDVHDELNLLCELAGIPKPEGDYLDGWTPQDWRNVLDEDTARLVEAAG